MSGLLRRERIQILLGYLLAGLVMAALLFMVGHRGILYFGADLQFHYNRIFEFHQNIAHGNWFPTISTYSANQIGSNVIAMYPPFPTYIGALLLFIMPGVPAIYLLLWLQFMTQFGIARFVSYKFGLTQIEANVSAFIFMTATPLVTQTIQQWLMGEVWAMSFMSLVVLGLYRLTVSSFQTDNLFNFKEAWPSIWPLVVGFTGILFSHVLSFAIVLVFAGMYSLLLLVFSHNRVKIFISFIISALWTIVLSAAFLFPFVQNTLGNKMFTPHADQFLNTWSAPRMIEIWEQAFEFRSNSIGILAIAAVLIGVLLFFKFEKQLKYCFAIAVLLVLSGTYYVWKYLYSTPLNVIQFPHRIFALPIFLLSILLIFEIRKLYEENRFKNVLFGIAILVNIAMLFTGIRVFWLNELHQKSQNLDYTPTIERPVLMQPVGLYNVHSDTINNLTKYWATYGAFDYLPKSTKTTQSLLTHEVKENGRVISSKVKSEPNGIQYTGEFLPGKITLPFVAYNAHYRVVDQNGHTLPYTVNDNRQFDVKLNENTQKISIQRLHSSLEIFSIVLTVFAFILSISFVIWMRYKR